MQPLSRGKSRTRAQATAAGTPTSATLPISSSTAGPGDGRLHVVCNVLDGHRGVKGALYTCRMIESDRGENYALRETADYKRDTVTALEAGRAVTRTRQFIVAIAEEAGEAV